MEAEAQEAPPRKAPAQKAVAVSDLSDSSLYVNPELAQLKFIERVLGQAVDEQVPLLERLRFRRLARFVGRLTNCG